MAEPWMPREPRRTPVRPADRALGSGALRHPAVRRATRWEALLADSLRAHGAEPGQAAQLATLVVAAVEGMVAMCRAKRSTEPLDRTAGQLRALVAAATAK
ncbi:hypothetical protein [Streptomyces achromogenes]|uniref:LmrA/YxaF family transcription factor n=1 Tax=Streptomyces achromogenes TaxID=67255 RepID=UPI00367CF80E